MQGCGAHGPVATQPATGGLRHGPAAQPVASGVAPASPACRSAAVSAERGVPLASGDRPPLLRAGDGGGLGDSADPVRTAARPFCTRASERAERETGGEVATAAGAGAGAVAELGGAPPARQGQQAAGRQGLRAPRNSQCRLGVGLAGPGKAGSCRNRDGSRLATHTRLRAPCRARSITWSHAWVRSSISAGGEKAAMWWPSALGRPAQTSAVTSVAAGRAVL